MAHASVIGCGNMGSALVKGLSRTSTHEVTAYDVDPDALDRLSEYPVRTTTDLAEATESPIVVVAVKPDVVGAVLDELDLSPDQTLVSFAAGVPTAFLERRTEATVVRVMPNLA
ncbi:pyrroline-5-carboxylate reductase family protein, partial [Halobium palmae]